MNASQTDADMDPLMDNAFGTPSMQERVELITHLLRHSDRLFTIICDEPTMLSAFAHALTREDTPGLHFAEVYPSAGMDAEDIAMHLARGWGVEVNFGETAMNALFQRLAENLREPRRAVAIVHGAESLPPMILDGLIGFLQRLDHMLDGRVRLILTGSNVLSQRLAPMQTLSDAGQVYALHLQPPPSSATPADDALDTLATEPEANTMTPPLPPKAPISSSNARGLLIGGLGVSLLLAVAVALLLRPDKPEPAKDTTVTIPLNPGEANNTATAPATLPTDPTTSSASASQLPESSPTVVEAQAKATAPAAAVASSSASSPTQPSVYQDHPRTPTPSVAPPADNAIKSKHTDGKESGIATARKPTTTPAAKTPDNTRFAASNASQYVVQIISLGSAKAVQDYIKQHDLEDCHSFQQQREGKTLYSLTCGFYPSREAAAKAVQALPQAVQAGKPFPRQIADIRKVMQN